MITLFSIQTALRTLISLETQFLFGTSLLPKSFRICFLCQKYGNLPAPRHLTPYIESFYSSFSCSALLSGSQDFPSHGSCRAPFFYASHGPPEPPLPEKTLRGGSAITSAPPPNLSKSKHAAVGKCTTDHMGLGDGSMWKTLTVHTRGPVNSKLRVHIPHKSQAQSATQQVPSSTRDPIDDR